MLGFFWKRNIDSYFKAIKPFMMGKLNYMQTSHKNETTKFVKSN